jgi:hypothetical protein
MKLNNKTEILLGGLAGIILPFLILIILHSVRFNHYSFNDFIERIVKLKIAAKFISLCAIPNLLLFFIFIWLNKLNTARGVLGATLLLTFIILIFKFI